MQTCVTHKKEQPAQRLPTYPRCMSYTGPAPHQYCLCSTRSLSITFYLCKASPLPLTLTIIKWSTSSTFNGSHLHLHFFFTWHACISDSHS